VKPVLRLHHFEPASESNGPGKRAVLWVQGCTLGCPGCFNPQTHGAGDGQDWPVEKLLQEIVALARQIEGITVSGGEPLQQMQPLLALLEAVRARTSLSVLVFTGYNWQEIERMPAAPRLGACTDVLLAGRYLAGQRLARGLLGSKNKTAHFLTGRYSVQDLQTVPVAEAFILPGGDVLFSGIDPIQIDQAKT